MSNTNEQSNGQGPPAFLTQHKQLNDPDGKDLYPNLYACLAPVFKDDKCVRESGSIRLVIAGGWYRVTVQAPSEGVQTTITVTSLVDLLEAVESALRGGETPWVPDYNSVKKHRQQAIRPVQ